MNNKNKKEISKFHRFVKIVKYTFMGYGLPKEEIIDQCGFRRASQKYLKILTFVKQIFFWYFFISLILSAAVLGIDKYIDPMFMFSLGFNIPIVLFLSCFASFWGYLIMLIHIKNFKKFTEESIKDKDIKF